MRKRMRLAPAPPTRMLDAPPPPPPPGLPARPGDLPGDLADVGADVAVVGWLPAAGARLDRLAQTRDLAAEVVDVELAVDVVPAEGEQAGERVAVRGVAAVADVQRAGRVGRDE